MDERIEMWKLMYSFIERNENNINDVFEFVDDIFCKDPSLIRSFAQPTEYNNMQDNFIMWLINKFLKILDEKSTDKIMVEKNIALQRRILIACHINRPLLFERIVRAFFHAIGQLNMAQEFTIIQPESDKKKIKHPMYQPLLYNVTAFLCKTDCLYNIAPNFKFDEINIRADNYEKILESWMTILFYALNIGNNILSHLFEYSMTFVLSLMETAPLTVKLVCLNYLKVMAETFRSRHIQYSMKIYSTLTLKTILEMWRIMPIWLRSDQQYVSQKQLEEFLYTTLTLLMAFEPYWCNENSFKSCFKILQLIVQLAPQAPLSPVWVEVIYQISNIMQQMLQLHKVKYDFNNNEIDWLINAGKMYPRLIRFLAYNESTITSHWWPWWLKRVHTLNHTIPEFCEEFLISINLLEYYVLTEHQMHAVIKSWNSREFTNVIKPTALSASDKLKNYIFSTNELEIIYENIVKNFITMAESTTSRSSEEYAQMLLLGRLMMSPLALLKTRYNEQLWEGLLKLLVKPFSGTLNHIEAHIAREVLKAFATTRMPLEFLPKAQQVLLDIGRRVYESEEHVELRLVYSCYLHQFIAAGTLTCQQIIKELLTLIVEKSEVMQNEFNLMWQNLMCIGNNDNCDIYVFVSYALELNNMPELTYKINCNKCHKATFPSLREGIAQGFVFWLPWHKTQTQADIEEIRASYVPIKNNLLKILFLSDCCNDLSKHLHELPILPEDVLQLWLDNISEQLNNEHLIALLNMLILNFDRLGEKYSLKLSIYLLKRTCHAIMNKDNLAAGDLKIQQLKILHFFRNHTKCHSNDIVLQYAFIKICLFFLMHAGTRVSHEADICVMEICAKYNRRPLQLWHLFKRDALTMVIQLAFLNYMGNGISYIRSLQPFSNVLGFSCVQEFICRYHRLMTSILFPLCIKYPISQPMLMSLVKVTRKSLPALITVSFLQTYSYVKLSMNTEIGNRCIELALKSTDSTIPQLMNNDVQQTVSTFLIHFNRNPEFVMEAFKYLFAISRNAITSTSNNSNALNLPLTYRNCDGRFAKFISDRFLGILTYFEACLAENTIEKSVKEETLYSLGKILRTVGPDRVTHYRFKIIAMLTFVLSLQHEPKLQQICLKIWQIFLHIVNMEELGPSINTIVAALYPMLDMEAEKINEIFEYIILENDSLLCRYIPDLYFMVNMEHISSGVRECVQRYTAFLHSDEQATVLDKIKFYMKQIENENLQVRIFALEHLRDFVNKNRDAVNQLILRELQTDSSLKQMLDAVKNGCWNDDKNLQFASAQCLGEFGAVDPSYVILQNGHEEINTNNNNNNNNIKSLPLSVLTDDFAINILRELCYAYQFQKNTKYVDNFSLAIQETLAVCAINPFEDKKLDIWNEFPEHMRQIMTPLLKSCYTPSMRENRNAAHPIFASSSALNYEDWAFVWSTRFLKFVRDEKTRYLLTSYKPGIVRDNKILAIIFPYMLLHALLDATTEQSLQIYEEFDIIFRYITTQHRDNIDHKKRTNGSKEIKTLRQAADNKSSDLRDRDKMENIDDMARSCCKLCVEQLSFLQGWCYEWVRKRSSTHAGYQRIHAFLEKFDKLILARASYNIDEFPRALMHLESYIQVNSKVRLQEQISFFIDINGHLQDTDSIEGALYIKETKLSLKEAILVNRFIDRPQEAMMCYEQLINNNDKDNLTEYDFNGLIDCYLCMDVQQTARLLTDGIWQRFGNHYSEDFFKECQIKVLSLLGEWNEVSKLVADPVIQRKMPTAWNLQFAEAFLLFRQPEIEILDFIEQLNKIRSHVMLNMKSCSSSGQEQSLTLSYSEMLKLHLLNDMEQTKKFLIDTKKTLTFSRTKLLQMFDDWDARISVVRPMLRTVEPILSFRRQLLESTKELILPLSDVADDVIEILNAEIGKLNLSSSRFYRKANHLQQAHLSIMKAEKNSPPSLFIEKAKLLWRKNDQSNTFKLLDENLARWPEATKVPDHERLLYVEAKLLQANYSAQAMNISSEMNLRYYRETIVALKDSEKCYVNLAQYMEKMYEAFSKERQKSDDGRKILMEVMLSYAKSLRHGHDDVYQSLPRMLTIWLDYTAQKDCSKDTSRKMNDLVNNCCNVLPMYVFFTTLSQLLIRICHPSLEVFAVLRTIIIKLLDKYQHQTLWMMLPIYKSSRQLRVKRSKIIFTDDRLKDANFQKFLSDFNRLTERLIELTNKNIDTDHPQALSNLVPQLAYIFKDANFSNILLPFEKFMQPYFPPSSPGIVLPKTNIPVKPNNTTTPAAAATAAATTTRIQTTSTSHGGGVREIDPFPHKRVYIKGIEEEVVVMRSAARPKKIIIICSNGKKCAVMVKPKDDLRKDFRLMEFNGLVKRFLHLDAEARHRHLRIRTYAVIPFNDECGLVEWLPNLNSFRSICNGYYRARGQGASDRYLRDLCNQQVDTLDKKRDVFLNELLPKHPPVFHEWLLQRFNTPSSWYEARSAYIKTLAVMSMVGYILGLGDRHGENLLFDETNGDAVHVDFNCLFNQGESFACPELVPFRLTHNLVHAMGPLRAEGIYRRCCEITLRVLREQSRILLSVLRPFVYDSASLSRNTVHEATDPRAVENMRRIEQRLQGYVKNTSSYCMPLSLEGQVNYLMLEATNIDNLARMYIGWGAFI